MKVKKVNRYYCDFCKKSGCSATAIIKHEKRCTNNPDRECGMCKMAGYEQVNIKELLDILPDPDLYHDPEEWPPYSESLAKAIKKPVERLREKVKNCPACILSALRQKDIPVGFAREFDFESEKNEWLLIWGDGREKGEPDQLQRAS